MRTSYAVLLVLTVGLMGGCSLIMGANGSDSDDARFSRGVAALTRRDYTLARMELGNLAARTPPDDVARKAMLLLAAGEMDPRNVDRRLGAAISLSARYLSHADTLDTFGPLAETLYLVAIELGGIVQRIAQAETAKQEAVEEARRANERARRAEDGRPLPNYPGTTMFAQLQQEKAKTADLEKRLAQLQEELDRIRKTVRP